MAKSVSQLLTEISTNLPDNTTGAITPATVRATLDDIVNSYVNTVDLVPLASSSQFGLAKVDGSTITAAGGVLSATGGGGGGGGGGNVQTFATARDAQMSLTAGVSGIQLLGRNAINDGGAAFYAPTNSPIPMYFGAGQNPTPVPPGLTTGGIPVLVFSTTGFNISEPGQGFGQTLATIFPGDLVVAVVFDAEYNNVGNAPASYTDSAGNTYTLAVQGHGNVADGTQSPAAIYYCVNPVYTPVGTLFNLRSVDSPNNQSANLYVYQVPGFTGAVLDQVAVGHSGAAVGSLTITTPALTGTPSLAIGATNQGFSPRRGSGLDTNYSFQPGWLDITPPVNGNNPIGVSVATAGTEIYTLTWTGTLPVTSVLATFKTFSRSSIGTPNYYQLQPTWPMHTAQYGIDTQSLDNFDIIREFSRYLPTAVPPSDTTLGASLLGYQGTTQDPATVTIAATIGNPIVVTYTLAAYPSGNGIIPRIFNSQRINFLTTGALPAPLVAGKNYYVQLGTIQISGLGVTFQISETTIYNYPLETTPKGSPVLATGNTQSGTHSLNTYGDGWTELVLDPGTYFWSGLIFPGQCSGLRNLRVTGYGARVITPFFLGSNAENIDVNNPVVAFFPIPLSCKFNTTSSNFSSLLPTSITLTNATGSEFAKAADFWINSWVLLTCGEMMGDAAQSNRNQYTFEYAKVRNVNPSTGVITFYDPLQYQYRSTFPSYISTSGYAGNTYGPANICMLADGFNQTIEVKGLTITGGFQFQFGDVLRIHYIDCIVYSWGFKTGPFPTTLHTHIMERCQFYGTIVEVDKVIHNCQWIDCTFDEVSHLIFQSASINNLLIDRCRMQNLVSGSAKNMTIKDSFISGAFSIGPVFGNTERIYIEGSHINQVTYTGLANQFASASQVTFSNGTLKVGTGTLGWQGSNVAGSFNPIPYMMPGWKAALCENTLLTSADATNSAVVPSGTAGMILPFTCLDVYEDGSHNYCIDTTLQSLPGLTFTVTASVAIGTNQLVVTALSPADACIPVGLTVVGGDLPVGTIITQNIGIPNSAGNIGTYTLSHTSAGGIGSSTFTLSTPLVFLQHPCARLTVANNCTGGRFVSDMNGAPPDIPIWSYFKRAYAGFGLRPTFENTIPQVTLAGKLIYWEIDVRTPYTGAQAAYTAVIGMYGYKLSGGNYYPTFVTQTIDLKTVGVRTLSQGSPVGSVGADSLVAVPFWLSASHSVSVGLVHSGDTLNQMPYFVMTAQTKHGIEGSSLVTNTLTAGADCIADSVMQAVL